MPNARPLPAAAPAATADPALAHRSFHQWLPFWLGQGYGQQGYAHHDRHTDWWWYDRAYWRTFFDELAADGFNAYVLWNAHPFPALIDLPRYPEANLFAPERRERNIAAFRHIVQAAKARGIEIVLQQYNIQVAPGFAHKHGLPYIENNGYGGVDSPVVRDYTAYCVERLFETHPDLGGLMTTFELNKDAFGFLRDGILAPLRAHGRAKLHFRLWGQHFTDEVARLWEYLPERVVLWHKGTEELICLPEADRRLAWWREQLPHMPLCALVGPCNASGFNFLSRQFIDPAFTAAQVRAFQAAGVTGMGWTAGEDNQWIEEQELDEHDQRLAMERWRGSASVMRFVAGQAALDPADDLPERVARHVRKRFGLSQEQASALIAGISAASRADLPYFRRVSPYRGHKAFGLNGACGRHSLRDAALPAGTYRLLGPYALPLHDWGRHEQSLWRLARSPVVDPRQSLPELSEMLGAADDADRQLDRITGGDETVRTLRGYGRLNAQTARYHAHLMAAALWLHRALHEHAQPALERTLCAARDAVDEALRCARAVGALAREIPATRVTQRPDLESPHRVGGEWVPRLEADGRLIDAAIALSRRHRNDMPRLHAYYQSWEAYVSLSYTLPEVGMHATDGQREAGIAIMEKALAHAREAAPLGPGAEAWMRRLVEERTVLDRAEADASSGRATLVIAWRSLTFCSTLSLPQILASDPAAPLDLPSRRVEAPPSCVVGMRRRSLEITLDGVPESLHDLRIYWAGDERRSRRVRVDLRSGQATGETAALVPPHALRFGEPFDPQVSVETIGPRRYRLILPLASLYPEPGERRWFNIGFGAKGPCWSCVPDAYADGVLGFDPQWMGRLHLGDAR